MSVSRREFIATSAAAAAMFGFAERSRAFAQDTADIRIAQIGFRSRGQHHLKNLQKNIVALCDVDGEVLQKTADGFKQEHGKTLDTYTDYRKLLEREDIDAVAIATPNHTHALLAVAAAQAGKDVYLEKPVSHNIWEGRQIVAAARKYDRIIQCGTQSRSSTAIRAAIDYVRSGALGKIQYVLGMCYKPRPSIGKLDRPLEIPKNLDYNLWCGPAEQRDLFRSQLHYDWHWDTNTGNGDMGNQGIHQMDIARWFLGESALPPRVLSIGGRLGYEDAGNTPNTQVAYFDYPDAPLIFETRGLPHSKSGQSDWAHSMDRYRGDSIGVITQCELGHVLVNAHDSGASIYDRQGNMLETWKGVENHFDNWLAAVAAHDVTKLRSEIREGHLSSSLCHLGGISHSLGKTASAGEISEQVAGNDLLSNSWDRMASHLRANDVDIDSEAGALTLGPWLELDPETEQFVNNDAASELRTRQYRAEFAVPDLES